MMIFALKCLGVNMESCNGGKQQYILNKCYSVKGGIKLCENGFHLTYQPESWKGSRVFVAQTPKVFEKQDDKMVCQKVRLLRELTPEMLAEYRKVEQQALAEYRKVEQPALAEYRKVKQQALAEYRKVEQQALAEYEKVEQQALAEYEKTLSNYLASLVKT
jgi:hypothetical protein